MSFEQGMVAGATWAGLSISEPADLVEIPNHLWGLQRIVRKRENI